MAHLNEKGRQGFYEQGIIYRYKDNTLHVEVKIWALQVLEPGKGYSNLNWWMWF